MSLSFPRSLLAIACLSPLPHLASSFCWLLFSEFAVRCERESGGVRFQNELSCSGLYLHHMTIAARPLMRAEVVGGVERSHVADQTFSVCDFL